METRRRVLAVAASLVVAGCGGDPEDSDGTDGPTERGRPTATPEGTRREGTPTTATGGLSLSTPAFADGATIPERYTGVGADVSPELAVDSVPPSASTLAVVVADPDADGFVHWLLWNVPADVGTIPEGLPRTERVDSLGGARQGTNGFGELGYRGPLPPEGDGPHTYRFVVRAVDTTLALAAGAKRGRLESALDGHVQATAELTGEFER